MEWGYLWERMRFETRLIKSNRTRTIASRPRVGMGRSRSGATVVARVIDCTYKSADVRALDNSRSKAPSESIQRAARESRRQQVGARWQASCMHVYRELHPLRHRTRLNICVTNRRHISKYSRDNRDQATTSSDQRFGLSQQLCKRGKSPRAVVGSMRCVTHARTRGGRSNVDR